MREGSVWGIVCVALAAAALGCAASASAQTVYVGGLTAEAILPFDSGSLQPASPLSATTPEDVAVSPDGRTAYVVSYDAAAVYVVDTATNTIRHTIEGVNSPRAPAVSPDGSTLYVAQPAEHQVLPISTATDVPGTPIPTASTDEALAVSPDGRTLYAADYTLNTVEVIDTATGTVKPEPIEVGEDPYALAISPDGSTLYVADDALSGAVSVIDTASEETVGEPIEIGPYAQDLALSPDGHTLYGAAADNVVETIDTATREVVGEPIEVGSPAMALALNADGSRLFAMLEVEGLEAIDTATRSAVAPPAPLGGYSGGLALVPAQTPVPSFTVNPGAPGTPTRFDGGSSHDFDGKIATYDWEFGDGQHAFSAPATLTHTYAAPGTYEATLRVDSGTHCAGFVFTGQTANCAGPSQASTTVKVTVPATATGRGKPRPSRPSVRVHCPKSAGSGGCRYALQVVSGAPKRLKKGRLSKPVAESAVARAKVGAGRSALVALPPKPKFAAAIGKHSKAVVKRTTTIRGKARTDYPRLKLIRASATVS